MRQLLRQDHREFIRHGIVQMTRGSVSDEVAAETLDRFPEREFMEGIWEALGRDEERIGDVLQQYDGPLLLAQHVGCLSFTEDGFRDAVAAFPHARVVRVPQSPTIRPEFAEALRDLCEGVVGRDASLRAGSADA
jgi:hypothetical protein